MLDMRINYFPLVLCPRNESERISFPRLLISTNSSPILGSWSLIIFVRFHSRARKVSLGRLLSVSISGNTWKTSLRRCCCCYWLVKSLFTTHIQKQSVKTNIMPIGAAFPIGTILPDLVLLRTDDRGSQFHLSHFRNNCSNIFVINDAAEVWMMIAQTFNTLRNKIWTELFSWEFSSPISFFVIKLGPQTLCVNFDPEKKTQNLSFYFYAPLFRWKFETRGHMCDKFYDIIRLLVLLGTHSSLESFAATSVH